MGVFVHRDLRGYEVVQLEYPSEIVSVSTGNLLNFLLYFSTSEKEFPEKFRRKLSRMSKAFVSMICAVSTDEIFILPTFNQQYIISLDIKSMNGQ